MDQKELKNYRLLLKMQVMTLGGSTLLIGLLADYREMLTLLAAGLVSIVSSYLVARLVFRKYTAQQPGKLLVNFYQAEFVKITFTVVMFALLLAADRELNIITLVFGYVFIQVVPAILVNSAGRRG